MEDAFDKWFEEQEELNNSYKSICCSAWNAAILESALLVTHQFDEQEPWITPEDILELLAI